MKVFGQLEKAQVENLAADPTGADLVEGRFWFRTDDDQVRYYGGSATHIFADLDTAQSMSNKSLAGPVITDYMELVQQGSTPSNPAAGRNRIYFKTDGTPYTLDENGSELPLGSGSGSGGVNYIPDNSSNIESTVGDWLTDNGAGGSSGVLSLAVTTTSGEFLIDTASLELTKSAADGNGHFIKVASKTISPAHRGRSLYGSFEFKPISGYVAGDLIIEVYDVTNAAVLYTVGPEDLELLNFADKIEFRTETETTTAQVELRLKVNNTNTNAFEVTLDDFRLTVDVIVPSSIVGAPVEYTPSFTGFTLGNGIIEATYTRLGKLALIEGFLELGSTSSFSGTIGISGPPNLTFNPLNTNAFGLATAYVQDISAPANNETLTAYMGGSDQIFIKLNGSGGSVSTTAPFTWDTGDRLSFKILVEVNEWSAGASLSATEAMFLTASARYTKSASQTIEAAGAGEVIDFNSQDYDDFSLVTTGASWQFAVPRSGKYLVQAKVQYDDAEWTTGNFTELEVRVNGGSNVRLDSWEAQATTTTIVRLSGSTILNLQKGDLVDFFIDHNRTGGDLDIQASSQNNHCAIIELPDYNTFSVFTEHEYLDVVAGSPTVTTTADTWIDATGMELELTSGVWDIGYSALLFLNWVSTSHSASGNVGIFDSSNTLVGDSIALIHKVMASSTDQMATTVSKSIRITVPDTETYKLRIRHSHANTISDLTFLDESFSGVLTNPDNHSIFWARRVS